MFEPILGKQAVRRGWSDWDPQAWGRLTRGIEKKNPMTAVKGLGNIV